MIKRVLHNLSKKEILTLNRRNQVYLRPLNTPSAKRVADSKLITKRVLKRHNIKTPDLYKVVRTPKQLEYVNWNDLPNSFVIKPNQGSRGRGILIIYGKKKGKEEWISPKGETVTVNDFKIHIQKIFEGRFSLGERRDVALIEERLKTDNLLKKYSYKGIPDIRLIVYNQIPIMAMTRLPTKDSDGKANLHAGAICAGIDIGSGITTHAIKLKGKSILADSYEEVETTSDLTINLPLKGVQIPSWDEILEIAIKCQKASKLGYVGVDIAIDRDKGPMVFELNARPGLGIQTANKAGLRFRLERVEGIKPKSVKHSVRIAKFIFGGEISDEIEQISGKQIVNLVEKVTIYNKPRERTSKRKSKQIKKGTYLTKAFLDTGISTSRIDKGIAAKIGYIDAIKFFESQDIPKKFDSFDEAEKFINSEESRFSAHEDIVRLAKVFVENDICVKPVIKIILDLRGEKKEVEAIISTRGDMIYPLLLGRKELKDYLIDTSKTFSK
ncbi:MAG TPA: hypothetical protein ENN64_01070 [bacterium]|nr:hypothetical protein [bacterium]